MSLKLEAAKKCREIRQNAKIPMTKWAQYLGLKKEQIIQFEKGVVPIPTLVLVEYAKLKKENERKENEKNNKKNRKCNEH